jgi:hypothetical protein
MTFVYIFVLIYESFLMFISYEQIRMKRVDGITCVIPTFLDVPDLPPNACGRPDLPPSTLT